MNLRTYVVARDYGFASNPFHGYCTPATCKPRIRSYANIDDWIVGTGAKTNYGLVGYLIYAMKVDEVMDFDSYWSDPRFQVKKPVLNGSLKQIYGDNIYHRVNGEMVQADSHHSFDEGQQNPRNIEYDTGVDRILIAKKFVYYGSAASLIPDIFRPYEPTSEDLCCPGRGHRRCFHDLATAFESWLDERGEWGVQGIPLEFRAHRRISE